MPLLVRGIDATTLNRASGAVVAQAAAAAASMALQVAASRTLGAAHYGTFTIVLAVVVLLAALEGGWVGDARTVLDRHDPVIRGALAAYQLSFAVLGACAAAAGALVFDLVGPWQALLVGALGGAWMLEDAGRRLFMARLEFWKLVVNDVVYLGVAGAALLVARAIGGELSLVSFVAAMAIGSSAAVAAARLQLPRAEFRWGPVTAGGLREVAAFGMWRAAHAGIRPLTTVALRLMVVAVASRSALGRLEVARLLVAPVLIVVNGVGSFLLPSYARAERAGGDGGPTGWVAVALTGAIAGYGLVAIALADQLAPLLTAGRFGVDRVAVGGWCLFAIAFAAGVPAGTWLLAGRQSGTVFRLRAIDSGVGIALALGLVLAVGISAAPYGLALGAALGAGLAWSRTRHPDLANTAGGRSR